MTFRVGQKVVCIKQPDPRAIARYPGSNYPSKDAEYTIRAINEWPDGTLLRFEEIDNSHFVGALIGGLSSKIEPGFPEKYFVPKKVSRKDRVRA